MDGRVIHEGQADFVIRDALPFEHSSRDRAHQAAINGYGLLWTGYGNLTH
jgi:hypothetical protein